MDTRGPENNLLCFKRHRTRIFIAWLTQSIKPKTQQEQLLVFKFRRETKKPCINLMTSDNQIHDFAFLPPTWSIISWEKQGFSRTKTICHHNLLMVHFLWRRKLKKIDVNQTEKPITYSNKTKQSFNPGQKTLTCSHTHTHLESSNVINGFP